MHLCSLQPPHTLLTPESPGEIFTTYFFIFLPKYGSLQFECPSELLIVSLSTETLMQKLNISRSLLTFGFESHGNKSAVPIECNLCLWMKCMAMLKGSTKKDRSTGLNMMYWICDKKCMSSTMAKNLISHWKENMNQIVFYSGEFREQKTIVVF